MTGQLSCPICFKSFDEVPGSDLNTHANRCLNRKRINKSTKKNKRAKQSKLNNFFLKSSNKSLFGEVESRFKSPKPLVQKKGVKRAFPTDVFSDLAPLNYGHETCDYTQFDMIPETVSEREAKKAKLVCSSPSSFEGESSQPEHKITPSSDIGKVSDSEKSTLSHSEILSSPLKSSAPNTLESETCNSLANDFSSCPSSQAKNSPSLVKNQDIQEVKSNSSKPLEAVSSIEQLSKNLDFHPPNILNPKICRSLLSNQKLSSLAPSLDHKFLPSQDSSSIVSPVKVAKLDSSKPSAARESRNHSFPPPSINVNGILLQGNSRHNRIPSLNGSMKPKTAAIFTSISSTSFAKPNSKRRNDKDIIKSLENSVILGDISGVEERTPIPRWVKSFKTIEATNIIVDGFACRKGLPENPVYILTHFHSDHYMGLNEKWSKGEIYCSEITARLVFMKWNLKCKVQQLGIKFLIPEASPKTYCTFLDANHCPGAIMALFEVRDVMAKENAVHHLHVGDFRANKALRESLTCMVNRITNLYLDTTYCNPKYCFADQSESITFALATVRRYIKECGRGKVKFFFGSYSIGKEKLYYRVGEMLKEKILVSYWKYDLLRCLGIANFEDKFKVGNTYSADASIIVTRLGQLSWEELAKVEKQYPETVIVAFSPTGWARTTKETRRGRIVKISLPYSEHSSYLELVRFVKFIKAKRIIPTVCNFYQSKVEKQIKLLENPTNIPKHSPKLKIDSSIQTKLSFGRANNNYTVKVV